MDRDKELLLKRRYPLLYIEYDNPDFTIRNSCMAWGFECGDGWFDLLDRLSAKIEARLNELLKSGTEVENLPVALQVKEKFGGLRFYTRYHDDEIENLINEAEDESYRICMKCGSEGHPNEQGWVSTLCEQCRGDKS